MKNLKYLMLFIIIGMIVSGCKKKKEELGFDNIIYKCQMLKIDNQDSTIAVTIDRPEYSDIEFTYSNNSKVIVAHKSKLNNYIGLEGIVGTWDYYAHEKELVMIFTSGGTYTANPFWSANSVEWNVQEADGRFLMINVTYKAKPCLLELLKN